jgi:hypothetical protein
MNFENEFSIFIDPSILFQNVPNLVMKPDDFVTEIRNLLIDMGRTKTGKILLNSIGYHGREHHRAVSIEPHYPLPGGNKICNAFTGDTDAVNDVQNLFTRLFLDRQIAAVVAFTPSRFDIVSYCTWKHIFITGDNAPSKQDILFHELVHAFRLVSNKHIAIGDPRRVVDGGLSTFDNIEEFYAVLVTNIYMSEKNEPVRSSHHGQYTMDKEFDGSLEFYKISTKALGKIEQLFNENRGLAQALAAVPTHFNPLRAYCLYTEEVRRISRLPHTMDRDRAFGVISTLPGWDVWKNLLH